MFSLVWRDIDKKCGEHFCLNVVWLIETWSREISVQEVHVHIYIANIHIHVYMQASDSVLHGLLQRQHTGFSK